MKLQFEIDTNDDLIDHYQLLRTIITFYYSDWKEFVKEWAYELDSLDYYKCPLCEENVCKVDDYCRWCGAKLANEGNK